MSRLIVQEHLSQNHVELKFSIIQVIKYPFSQITTYKRQKFKYLSWLNYTIIGQQHVWVVNRTSQI